MSGFSHINLCPHASKLFIKVVKMDYIMLFSEANIDQIEQISWVRYSRQESIMD